MVGKRRAPTAAMSRLKSRNAPASAPENAPISRAVSASVLRSTNEAPSANRFSEGPAGLTPRPRSRSRMSRHTAGRSALRTYAPGDARYPGANSSVTHAPPTIPRRSRTSVRRPARAR